MTSSEVKVYISGVASPVSSSAMGDLALKGLVVRPTSETVISGFNNFPFIQLDKVMVVKGQPGKLILHADITMTSPSQNIACGTGDVKLFGYYNGYRLMTAYMTNFIVQPGTGLSLTCTLFLIFILSA
jgi:hypothetical protein